MGLNPAIRKVSTEIPKPGNKSNAQQMKNPIKMPAKAPARVAFFQYNPMIVAGANWATIKKEVIPIETRLTKSSLIR